MNDSKLIRMGNQITDFFRSQPGIDPAKAVAGHINDYWTYQMRQDLLDQLQQGGPDADPILRDAAAHLHIPARDRA